eukprot:TRINITY_DN40394_c0_g1_i1.p1 TRINITY_DN40394_c0_g1~~TRINITY_DN40394_c0_g1_i1.p1  ORF type:complete len:335 (+),score=89.52 TRINITY_DN40394_c0_g1_i1:260-1264(+)
MMGKTYRNKTLIGNWYENRYETEGVPGGSNILKHEVLHAPEPPFEPIHAPSDATFTSTTAQQNHLVDEMMKTRRKQGTAGHRHVEDVTYRSSAQEAFVQPSEQRAPFRLKDNQLTADAEALRAYRNRWTRNGPLIKKIRDKALARGAAGIKGLSRSFRIMDDNGDLALDYSEFSKGLRDYGFKDLDDDELQRCCKMFDYDNDGTVSIDEFLVAMRPPLNDIRKGIIDKAWEVIDENGDGVLTVDDIKDKFQVSGHPKVKSGEWTKQRVWEEWIESFDTPNDPGAEVTKEEFVNYYAGVSSGIDDDQHFVLLLTNAWKIGPISLHEFKKGDKMVL